MGTGAKILVLAVVGIFSGLTAAAWHLYGADVALAYLADLALRCF